MQFDRGTERVITETAASRGLYAGTGVCALAAAVNGLLAADVRRIYIDARISYPRLEARTGKLLAYEIKKRLKKECEGQGFVLKDLFMAECPSLHLVEVTVTAAGVCAQSDKQSGNRMADWEETLKKSPAHFDIVMAGWAGMEGMLRIAKEKETELRKRFSGAFLDQIQKYRGFLFAGSELDLQGECALIRQIREGGVFAAFYHLAQETGIGLEIDLKKIPILQETIEVCEYFRLNPYQLTSTGGFLILSEQGEILAGRLRQKGISAAVVGRTAEGPGKIMRNGDDIRYIDRPAPDEIYKIFTEKQGC